MWFRLFLTRREIALFDPLDYKYKIVDWMVGEVLDFDRNDIILTYDIRSMIIGFLSSTQDTNWFFM